MMNTTWNTALARGVAVHAGTLQPDGLAAWQPLKNELAPYDDSVGAWAPAPLDEATLAELEALQRLPGRAGEPAHYFRQILHIPRHEPCTPRKVAQVAYNLGQALGRDAAAALPAGLAAQVRPLLGLALADVVATPPAGPMER